MFLMVAAIAHVVKIDLFIRYSTCGLSRALLVFDS